MDLTKPKPNPTPDDYIYEQSIPDTPMTRKFGHLRGAKIKTVSETVADFFSYVSTSTNHPQALGVGLQNPDPIILVYLVLVLLIGVF